MATYIRNFDSLKSWIDYSENDSPEDGADRQSLKPRKDFTGVAIKEEAYNLFRMGHPPGLERMRSILQGLTQGIIMQTMHDEFLPSVEGSAPNVEAFVQGIPEDMFVISQVEANAPPSSLTVQFELAYAARITGDQAALAGAVVFAAMEALKLQGCNVTALMTHTVASSYHPSQWQAAVPVPNNLDLDTLAFIFTHPAMLRVMVFSIMEHEPLAIRQEMGFYGAAGYGRPLVQKHPHADCVISMAQLCNELFFGGYGGNDIPKAKELLQRLVDTRFGTMVKV